MIQNPDDEMKKECEKNVSLSKKILTNDYSNYNSSTKSEKIDLAENSLHSGRNSTLLNRMTPEPTKVNHDFYNHMLLEKELPRPKLSNPALIKEKINTTPILTAKNNKNIISLENAIPITQGNLSVK
jgi:phage gp16-like protein